MSFENTTSQTKAETVNNLVCVRGLWLYLLRYWLLLNRRRMGHIAAEFLAERRCIVRVDLRAAPRGLRHDHGTLCAVRHGLYAGCARQVPGTAHGRQNSPAHRASSVRIMGWIVGWKFPLFATKFLRMMVARDGVEPPTPAFSGQN